MGFQGELQMFLAGEDDCSTWNNFGMSELGVLVRWEWMCLRWV
jgi:hypothetical protein